MYFIEKLIGVKISPTPESVGHPRDILQIIHFSRIIL